MSVYSKKKVLILVKTYPALSKKYDELVCTAGLTEEGEWIRIYPIPFRLIDYDKQYRKFQWVEVNVIKNDRDYRPESHKVIDIKTIIPGDTIPATPKGWEERNRIILKNGPGIYNNLEDLIKQSKKNNTSLGILKPFKVIDFVATETEREWDQAKINTILSNRQQLRLIENLENDLKTIIKKVPYKFQYVFQDPSGRQYKLMIEDWEIGVLYWKMYDEYGDETIAIEKVRKKYFNDFVENPKRELFFFMGTTLAHHKSASPFVIIGVYSTPKYSLETMNTLFDDLPEE
ncbi:MAG: hypothetical protein IJF84_03275 [Thermoguttaceae bacterium]|nr:hypothetical protein [Thermoguttaceae bacterium]